MRPAPARIINVSSAGQAPIDFRDVMLERHWDGVQAYCRAKLAQISLTIDLAERLRGTGVTASALHPASYMPTKMVVNLFTPQSTVAEGVHSTLRLITDLGPRRRHGHLLQPHPALPGGRPGLRREGPRPTAVAERVVDRGDLPGRPERLSG
ncbi:hypothetical protein ACRAWF_12320 [Streptomyces sp. L7]